MFPTTRGRAQSSTTGAILLVAVFLLVTTTLGTALLDGTVSDPDPMASAEFDSEGTDLRITHLGGDALPNDELAVVVRANGKATRFPFPSPSGAFGFGDNRTFSDALVANASNDVRLYHEPSGTEIERATLTPRPDPTPETGSIEGAVVGPDAASRVASGASLGVRRSVAPVSGATVVVDGPQGAAEATTGPGGTYQIGGLEPGEYEVSATAPEFAASTATAEVERNATTTVDFRLNPLRPPEFDVEIAGVDRRVDAGNLVTVNATVENVGGKSGTRTVELRVDEEQVDSAEVELGRGQSRTVSLRWQTLPSDTGDRTLTVDAEDDEATTTVEVLDAATDAVAYVDRDGDGEPDETYTAVELAFLGPVDGHLVVFDDVGVDLPVGAAADRVTVRDGVAIRATAVSFESGGDLSVGRGASIDTSSQEFFGADAGDVSLRAGGDLSVRGAAVTTSANAWIGASAGDIDLTAGGDADLRDGAFEAVGTGWFSGDGRISVTAGGAVRTDGASFDPERE